MMAIDNLKDVWKNQTESTIQFSESDIYKMIQKKSASIVKWIFYIGIMEFLLLLLIPLFLRDNSNELSEYHLNTFFVISNVFNYIVSAVFLFLFYKNYKTINVQDTTKKLMNDILRTRKTVNYYVGFQLMMGAAVMFVLFYKMTKSNILLENLPENTSMFMIWIIYVVIVFVILILLWLVYKLIYGILLKKLKNNYKELLKQDKIA